MDKDMFNLTDKVAIVTGASSGMGREIALLYAKSGMKVLALARNEEKLKSLKEEAAAEKGTIEIISADVSVEDDITKSVNKAKELFGTVNILVNNAGVLDDYAAAGDVNDEVWEKTLQINTTAPMKFIRAVLPIMLEKEAGCIINIASVGGLHGARGGAAYVTSKHALIGLTRNTGFMYADKGIRCNAICPGSIATEIDKHSFGAQNGANEMGGKKLYAGIPLIPRNGEPNEIANVALFLASSGASYINGTEIVVDGGWTAY